MTSDLCGAGHPPPARGACEVARRADRADPPTDHLVVVDNDTTSDDRVRDLVTVNRSVHISGTRRNLGGAGGFALGMLHALALGADWVWCADDDGRPADSSVLAKLLACAERTGWPRCRRWCATWTTRSASRFRCGADWCGVATSANCAPRTSGPADGNRVPVQRRAVSRWTLEAVGVPDLRCSCAATRWKCTGGWCAPDCRSVPAGRGVPASEAPRFKRTRPADARKIPDDPVKRFFTYRNRG